MTRIDLQLGGGYVYQWECAILLALNYLMDAPSEYNAELHQLVNDFLGRVEAIHLEGKTQQQDTVELEDINLLADNRAVYIQVKARGESAPWTPSAPLLLKALYRFYCSPVLDQDKPLARFVFLSNRGFNPKLEKAIDASTATQSEQADALFTQLQKYVDREYPKASPLERPRFNRLLSRLAFIEFLPLDAVEAIIEDKLQALGVRDWKQAYESLYTKFSKGATRKGGMRVTLQDLRDFVQGLFTGHLIDYIQTEPRRSVARYVLHQAEATMLPPLGVSSTGVIGKIESIIGGNGNALNGVEAFILLVAACLPHLLRQYDDYAEELISSEQIHRLAEKLNQEPSAPAGIRTALVEVASEVSAVANARTGFELEDAQYSDSRVRDARVRLRLLGVLLHLAHCVNLDQAVDPTPPPALEHAPWQDRSRWWRQAYVCGVAIESQRLQLHIRLPKGRKAEYAPILVDPLDEEIQDLIAAYDPILFPAGINLKHLTANVIEGDVPAIPDNEWQRLKQEVETEQARRARDRLQQNVVRTQRLRELLVSAEVRQAEQMVAELSLIHI